MPSKERVEHKFLGDNLERCARCGKPDRLHRNPRVRIDVRDRSDRLYLPRPKKNILYLGIDGEGQGEQDHVYNMICASDETGEHTWILESPDPTVALTSVEIFEWMMGFPENARLFAFSFNYDLTKILKDLPDEQLYKLFRPEGRQRLGKDAFKGPRPVPWGEWRFNLQGTKFSIARSTDRRPLVIWDIWKFYQSKFTTALTLWKVGLKTEIERMILMKDKRGEFDKLSKQEVKAYCLKECQFMAQLAHKLVDAHVMADIPLKNFYGAGSSATAMLKKMKLRDYQQEPPAAMIQCVAQAFSGGRFDNRLLGIIRLPTRGADISSAYPYATQFLPCLAHGHWEHTKSRRKLNGARVACVRYSLRDSASVNTKLKPWGPFPFRSSDGSICYPAVSGGGWVWLAEFLEGERLFPNVEFREAWVFHQECDHLPFKDMPMYYNERCRIGKEGPGIVIKLASNSVPGKTAQSVGSAPFRNYVHAGMINSQCRAQVLTALGLHRDWRNMLMVATDGIQSLEMDLQLPPPIDTNTNIAFSDGKGNMVRKPLGGWELKDSTRGMFFARPGVYFPLGPSKEDIETVRARGVGRGVILQNWERLINRFEEWDKIVRPGSDGYDEDGWPVVKVANVSRFCGAKSSISRSVVDGKFVYKRASGNHMRGRPGFEEYDAKGMPVPPEPAYGQWITREVGMSFNPAPKRENTGLGDDGQSLLVRKLSEDIESAPYDKANLSEEARQLMRHMAELNEQPDKDFVDYEEYQG